MSGYCTLGFVVCVGDVEGNKSSIGFVFVYIVF